MNISYTFPADHAITELQGLTVTGGKFTTVMQNRKRVDAVAFDTRVNGKGVIAVVAGKPELEAALVAFKENYRARKDAAAKAEVDRALTLEGQRESLVRAEYNTYSPSNFPGSAKWKENRRAADALTAFDLEHPEVKAAFEAGKRAAAEARYDSLSEFVKSGS